MLKMFKSSGGASADAGTLAVGGGGPDGDQLAARFQETYTPICGDVGAFTREFAKKNFWMWGELSYGRVNWVRAFGCSRWESLPQKGVFLLRAVLAGFIAGIWVYDVVSNSITSPVPGAWPVYLTHWFLTVNLWYALSLLAATTMTTFVWGPDSTRFATQNSPWWILGAWYTGELSIAGGLVVVVLYWSVLYAPPLIVDDVLPHGAAWGALLLDYVLIGMQPFGLVHLVWGVLFGLCYAVWGGIFCAAHLVNESGDPYIYSILDWNNAPRTSLVWSILCVFVALPLAYLVIWFLNFARKQAIVGR